MTFRSYVIRPAADDRYGTPRYTVIPICQNCGKRGSFNPNVILDCICVQSRFTQKAETLHGLSKKGENLSSYMHKAVEYV